MPACGAFAAMHQCPQRGRIENFRSWRKAYRSCRGGSGSTSSVSEFMLGGRNLPPAVAALSAGASDMSGWMLMGLPGAIYLAGFSAVWIAVGLTIGAWANYRLIAPRLRASSEIADDAVTIPDYLEKRFGDARRHPDGHCGPSHRHPDRDDRSRPVGNPVRFRAIDRRSASTDLKAQC
jgi:Sodium:solute symporter family